jgi:hypothetical protein
MRTHLTALAVGGFCLAVASSADAQAPITNLNGYPLTAADLYAIPPGGRAMRVYGPGTTATYPFMYQSNRNPSYAQRYTYTYYQTTPYGPYPVYRWSR